MCVVPTLIQVADILTKALLVDRFLYLKDMLHFFESPFQSWGIIKDTS